MPVDEEELVRWVYGDELSNVVYQPMLDAPWYKKLSEDFRVPQHEVFQSEESLLTVRERMLVNLAIQAVMLRERSLRSRCHGLLRGGFSAAELAEVFRQVALYCGMPAAVAGSVILAEAERDLKAAGVLPEGDE